MDAFKQLWPWSRENYERQTYLSERFQMEEESTVYVPLQRVPSRANIPALKPALKVPDKEKEGNVGSDVYP
ncbi:hypothetical protein EW026_g7086 [Hermanssonia centrifuga]|uniref:Uncharacterized protein n=1 Tax=Hermanssonia centrifuga TaxID=98765 RepID=A0A4S4K913_9APHY|nr:hypothetical protein EW026_g7086 [Hermanssonia centrifuga]